MIKGQRTTYIAVAIVSLAVGIIVAWYVPRVASGPKPISPSGQVRVDLPQYKFINPPLYSDSPESTDPAFIAFTSDVADYIQASKKSGSVNDASMYFRDLNGGQWGGVNEDALYTPSSMLKVVAMMAALKLAESDPTILNRKLKYTKSMPGSKDYFNADDGISTGIYSLQDLIGYMIKYSDNDAFNAIVSDKQINAEFVQVYSLFRLPPDALTGNTVDFMSPKSFSSIFRVLYNSSFFEWDLSEQILELLSQTTFTQGLVAGVPSSTLVSHKFGENTDELHDCGIVYYPDHPYLICIMTRGQDGTKLESVIAGISKIAWNFVDKNNK